MDMESGKQQFITVIKKYQYVLLVILIGVFLMLLPANAKENEMTNNAYVSYVEEIGSSMLKPYIAPPHLL